MKSYKRLTRMMGVWAFVSSIWLYGTIDGNTATISGVMNALCAVVCWVIARRIEREMRNKKGGEI